MLDEARIHRSFEDRPPQAADCALSRLIAAAAVVQSVDCDLAEQVPPARITRIMLLAAEMERLVLNLSGDLHRVRRTGRAQ